MILVVGHKNPDSDSICSALVAAELLKARGLDAKAIRQGDINRENPAHTCLCGGGTTGTAHPCCG